MRYIVVDLEATCWDGVRGSPKMEIIEIGAVQLASCHSAR
jgi:inhibitor of KinA sporulation pathway (predicted exonuclease)